ncbi:MAG TPA: hypothetical protein VGO39_13285 [Gaiellaceae bacterium]|nr:hypothetical protein [Gaiellaceae bacterium]
MTRGLVILTALLATLAVAIPASAAEGRSLRGLLVTVSSSAVAVQDTKKIVTTCAVAAKSPSLDGYTAGDRVQATCVRSGGKLVLAKIRLLTAKSGSTSNDSEPTKFAGAVTAAGDGSISLHDGDRDLTCSIGASSPSTAGVKVGQHVKVSCSNGVLVTLSLVSSGDAGRAYEGTVTALSTTSITVHTDKGDGTCALADGSPSLADVKVGDRILAGCKAGTSQLVYLKKLAASADKPSGDKPSGAGSAHKTTGAAGTVSALSATSLTVHTDGGEVTCSVGDGSPSVANVHVGDTVKIGCVDGVLKVLSRADTPAGSGDGHKATTVAGTLTALSTSSLTVHGEHGDVTCTVPATARLGDFHVGDRVGMACVDGALYKLLKL